MQLIIVRHGQSEADILNCLEGRADFSLTQDGLNQAILLAEWLQNNDPPNMIISSTLKRAVQTAEVIGKKVNVDVKFDQDLMEYNNGLLKGLSHKEADEKYPLQPEYKKSYISYYGQETLIEFRARSETVLSRIIYENEPDKKIVIVSHGGMINMLFRSFMKLPINCDFSISCGDTSIHKFEIIGEKRNIIYLNRMDHLRDHGK